ncbi:MAG: hypothetical protein AAB502_01600, partial [Chloroflexota bacterium]
YDWAPKWADVEKLFLKQINVERFNKPESEWLNRFAKTAQNVVEGAQKIKSATKIFGRFVKYEDEKMVIEGKGPFTPAFDVTLNFLDSWLNTRVEVLVLNEMAVRLKELGDFDSVVREYPPPQPDEIPF